LDQNFVPESFEVIVKVLTRCSRIVFFSIYFYFFENFETEGGQFWTFENLLSLQN